LRADAATNSTLAGKLNVIVLFTDGLPNGLTANANDYRFNVPPNPANSQYYMMKQASGCPNLNQGTNVTPVTTGAKNMVGWFAQWGGYAVDNAGANGLFPQMMATAYPGTNPSTGKAYTGQGDDIDQWLADAGADTPRIGTVYVNTGTWAKPKWVQHDNAAQAINADAGCLGGYDGYDSTGIKNGAPTGKHLNTNGTPMITSANPGVTTMAAFPVHDIYGNYTDLSQVPAVGGMTPPGGTNGDPLYKMGDLYSGQCNNSAYDSTATANSCQIGLASWQATAHQAWKIWNQVVWDSANQVNKRDTATYAPSPVIFTIGFDHNPNDPPDMNLLEIIANAANSPIVTPSNPSPFNNRIDHLNGKAYLATTNKAVDDALTDIASEILRLAQ
jgi:hypothetical protein